MWVGDETAADYRWLSDGTKSGVRGYTGGSEESGFEYLGSLVYQRATDADLRAGLTDGLTALLSHKTPEFEHQEAQDKKSQNEARKTAMKHNHMVDERVPNPDPDGSQKPDPDTKLGPVGKIALGVAGGAVILETVLDTNQNEKPDDGLPTIKKDNPLPEEDKQQSDSSETKYRYKPFWERLNRDFYE